MRTRRIAVFTVAVVLSIVSAENADELRVVLLTAAATADAQPATTSCRSRPSGLC